MTVLPLTVSLDYCSPCRPPGPWCDFCLLYSFHIYSTYHSGGSGKGDKLGVCFVTVGPNIMSSVLWPYKDLLGWSGLFSGFLSLFTTSISPSPTRTCFIRSIQLNATFSGQSYRVGMCVSKDSGKITDKSKHSSVGLWILLIYFL